MTTENDFRIRKEDNVKIDFYSELMPNYFPESGIEAGHDIRTLMISEDRPMVFCLDKSKRLQAILRSEGSEAGWVKLMLSEGEVNSFELEFNSRRNSFRIAKSEANKAWVSQEIRLEGTDFENLNDQLTWTSFEANSQQEQVNKVSLGVEHMLFASSTPGHDAQYYLADLKNDTTENYTLPENGMKVIQFELGDFYATHGVFMLYTIGEETSMLYQSFPHRRHNKTTKVRFDADDTFNSFTLLNGEDGQDIVYAAGKHVHEFVFERNTKGYEVKILPGEVNEAFKIRAARHGSERSVWTLHEQGLYHRTNRFYNNETEAFETDRWTQPLLMVDGADQFSCIKGRGIRNQLFTINTAQGSRLTRLWQDSVTTIWNQHEVHIASLDQMKEVDSYSAHIRFSADTLTRTFAGLEVKLSADSNIFVYVNNKSYHIGPDREVAITLGLAPDFTVICPIKGLASSKLILKADFLNDDIAIDLTEKTLERLDEKASTGSKLKEATRPNGDLLVPKGTDPEILASAAAGIKDMVSAASELRNKPTGNFQTKEFSLTAAAGGRNAGLSALSGAGHSLGDFFHSVWEKIQGVASFIIEKVGDAFRFVIKIGEDIFNFIVKTIHEIGGFLQKVFESIKVFFKDLFEFLAFLFDWDSIIETKDAFKGFAKNAMHSFKSEIGNIRKFVDKQLDAEIAKFSPELVNIPDSLAETDPAEPGEQAEADPRSNWLNSKKEYIQNGKSNSLLDALPGNYGKVIQEFIDNVGPVLQQLGEGFLKQVETLFADFKRVLNGELNFGEFLKILLQKLAGFSLFLVKSFLDILLVSLESLVAIVIEGVDLDWNIPFISPLYRKISGGSDLSILEIMCLFVAIPTNILYKIGVGRAPFGESLTKDSFIQAGNNTFALNLNI